MSTLTLADKASTSGASASTSKMEAGDLHDPLLEAGIAADEALADPLASSTTGEQEKEEKKENPDPSLQLVGGHKRAGDIIKTVDTVAGSAGGPTTDALNFLGVDEGITEHISPGFSVLGNLADAADGANRLGAVVDGTSGLGVHAGESAVHNGAERAVGAIGGIKTLGTGLADATTGITSMVGDPVLGTDESGEDKTLTSEIGTGKTAFGHVADAATSLATAIKKTTAEGSTEGDRAHATLTGIGGVARSGGAAASNILDLVGHSSTGADIELGGNAVNHITSLPTGIMDAVKTIESDKSSRIDRTEAVGNAMTGLSSNITSAGKNISTLAGESDVADNFDAANKITGGVASTFAGGIGLARGLDKIIDGGAEHDNKRVLEGTAEFAGNSLNTASAAIKLTSLVRPVAEEVLEHADVVGSVGTGVVGLGTMVSSGDAAIDAGEIAYALRDDGSIGDDIDETRDVFRAKLAKRYGIDTSDPEWEDLVDAEVVRRLEKADDHKADFMKLVQDPTFAKYMQARTVDEIREYAQLRKVLKTVLLTSESFGKGLSSIGTATAAADGGATKIAGTVLGTVPEVARIIDKAGARMSQAGREVEASDVMKGYNKPGTFTRMGQKVGGALGAVGDAISPVTKPLGKGIATAGKAVYNHVLAPTGRGIAKVGGGLYDHALAPAGRGLKKAGGALHKHVLKPVGRAISKGASATVGRASRFVYDNALAPAGRAITKGAKATWRGVEKTAGFVGGGIAKGAKATWGGLKHVGGKIGGLFSRDEEVAPTADAEGTSEATEVASEGTTKSKGSKDAGAETKSKSGFGTRVKKGLSKVGDVLAKPFKAFGTWFKADVWETTDMKWARKLAATVRGPKAGEVAKQWHAAKKDPESPEGMLIRKLEENDFETFLEIEEELDGEDHISEHARDLAELVEGQNIDPEVRADAVRVLKALGVSPEKHAFTRAMPKLRALDAFGIDAKKMPGPSAETLAKHPDGALAIKGKDGKQPTAEELKSGLETRATEVSTAKQERLSARIEAALQL